MAKQRSVKLRVVLFCSFLIFATFMFSNQVFALATDPDLNDDGIVNILDVTIVSSCFGMSSSDPNFDPRADTDGDSDVDYDDLLYVYNHFGETYPIISVEIGSPQVNVKSFFYDEATNIIVNISVAPEQGVTVSNVTLLKTDALGNILESLGNLFDDGNVSNGDDIASDGVYSTKKLFQESSPGDIYLKISAIVAKDGASITEYSESFSLEALDHISDEDYSEALNFPNIVEQKYNEFLVDFSEDEAKTKTVEWLEEQPEIGKAGIAESGKGIWWVLESGILGGIFLSPEDTLGNIGSKATLDISPFYDWVATHGGDSADGAYKVIQDSECPSFNAAAPLKNAAGTVEAFKTLSNHGIIVITTHGDTWYNGILSWWQDKWGTDIDFFENWFSQVVLSTATEATEANKKLYEMDLTKHRLAISKGGRLVILPSFIIHYNKKFPDSLVLMNSCRSLYNDTIADAFIKQGAKTYYGYTEYVLVGYAYKCGKTLLEYLLEGKTAKEAFDQTIIDEGPNDLIGGFNAAFKMKGDSDLTITEFGIVNGGFEDGLTAWTESGDVRIIPKLGPLSPTEGNYMAIISTGLGSVNDSNSEIYQSFCFGSDPTNLSFDYNVVSEEPMEWVGTQYDDKFQVVLLMADGSQQQLAYESVNSSSWKAVSGIDFYGGDNTTYMTDWKHVDIDISAYPDAKAVVFKAHTWDVGDSLWDTAALIDNIKLYKQ